MELMYKAQIFALFAVPSILALGVAEIGKPEISIVKWSLYIFSGVSGVLSLIMPFVH